MSNLTPKDYFCFMHCSFVRRWVYASHVVLRNSLQQSGLLEPRGSHAWQSILVIHYNPEPEHSLQSRILNTHYNAESRTLITIPNPEHSLQSRTPNTHYNPESRTLSFISKTLLNFNFLVRNGLLLKYLRNHQIYVFSVSVIVYISPFSLCQLLYFATDTEIIYILA